MSDIDTTAAPVRPGLPGRPGTSFAAGRPAANDVPAGPPADPAACLYYLSTRDGKAYAVELRDGWIPVRVVGPFAGDALLVPPHQQDWSAPTDARGWNVATLVPLCDRERALMVAGRTRSLSGGRKPARVPLPARRITDEPTPPAPE